jgi:hypothetical protein
MTIGLRLEARPTVRRRGRLDEAVAEGEDAGAVNPRAEPPLRPSV